MSQKMVLMAAELWAQSSFRPSGKSAPSGGGLPCGDFLVPLVELGAEALESDGAEDQVELADWGIRLRRSWRGRRGEDRRLACRSGC